jgi:hypothetical protein
MKAVVVYESMYGNTRSIADAVATGLRSAMDAVVVVSVTDADSNLARSADLLVVGGPTHAHGLSRASTRTAALEAAKQPGSELTMDPNADGQGIREWLASIEHLDTFAAAFDTRLDAPPVLTGRASKGMARKLRRLGCTVITGPESFLVTKQTRIKPGEEDRARDWGVNIAARLSPAEVSPARPGR